MRATMLFVNGVPLSLALVVALGACGFTLTASDGGDDGIPDGRRISITDDTAAEFANNGGLVDGVVATPGALEPDAFVLGGLKGRAHNNNVVNASRSYDDVVAALGARLGFAYQQVPKDLGAANPNWPRGMGITGGMHTILYDGEILLPQGMVTIVTDADDDMLLQISLAPMTWSDKLFTERAEARIDLDVPAAGWYPIRAAFGQDGGSAYWRLKYLQPGGSLVAVDATRLRARVTADRGLIASAFEGKVLSMKRGEGGVATIDEDYGSGPPSHDLPITTSDQFSMRFAGQVRIDTEGSYTFSADIGTDPLDLFRIWIDGVQVANQWPPTVDKPSAAIDLTVGWHDLLVDFGEETGTAKIQVRMSGPGITEGVIDPQRLRPAVAFGHTASFVTNTNVPINDATLSGSGVTLFPMTLTAPAGATIASVDYGLLITNQRFSDLTIDLLDCSGAKTMPPITMQQIYYYYAADPSCAGSPVVPATPWTWRLTDNVIGNDPITGPPTLYNPMLIATYTGGDRVPFAPAYTFVSSPKQTTGSIGFAAIDVTADLRGALLMIEVRAGADPAALAAAAWMPVANGAVPAVEASEWAQYRLAVTSDGWKLASIDKVDLIYVVPDD